MISLKNASIFKKTFALFTIFSFFSITPSFSQKEVIKINQEWIQSYNEAKISSKWMLMLDGGYRWRDNFEASSYIIRGGAGYSLLPGLRVAGGLAHLGFYATEKVVRQEFRSYQEISFKTGISKMKFGQRFRIEERFFKNRVDSFNFDLMDFNYRFRYSMIFGIPLFGISAKYPDRKVILNLGDEIFINAGKEVGNQVFDQNRFIISPSIQWTKDLNFAFTWNTQFASTPNPETFVLSQVAWLQIRYNLDFTTGSEKN